MIYEFKDDYRTNHTFIIPKHQKDKKTSPRASQELTEDIRRLKQEELKELDRLEEIIDKFI